MSHIVRPEHKAQLSEILQEPLFFLSNIPEELIKVMFI